MDADVYPVTRDLVLVGGGHTHALVLNRWAMAPLPGVRVTVINPEPVAPYTGMLPGYIAGHYARDEMMIDLVRLARRAGARLIRGKATGIDPIARLIELPGRPDIPYDIVSLDIGITSDLPQIPGYAEHAVSAKPLGGYADVWETYLHKVERRDLAPRIAIIGGGVAGAELAMAMAHRLRDHPDHQITIIETANRILPNIGAHARQRLIKHLRAASINLREGVSVSQISVDKVSLSDDLEIDANLVLGAAGSRPQDWLQSSGLALHEGYVQVDPYLRSTSDRHVFAVGDCAHMAFAPRPKAGVFAVRQAPFLFANLRAALGAGVRRRYRPQRDYLKLVSLGDRSALADKWGLAFEGRWLWDIKDRIDAKFMGQFRKLRHMPPRYPNQMATGLRQILSAQPLCGGCGAKLGADPLQQALSGLARPDHDAVAAGIGDDAAILRIGEHRQVIATDHLRAMTNDLWLMARIAANHSLGDIWAMGATPQAALANVTLPRGSEQMQARMLTEITQGASAQFETAGVPIVGGHSSVGVELSIGFTVTGLVGTHALTKRGGQPGDVLVLTKALGTGLIMAAEMQAKASGVHVAQVLEAMLASQGTASRILADSARAMTDVTGFGLAGHLAEMLQGARLSAELYLESIPILPGAADLARKGISASVAPANRSALIPHMQLGDSARAAILFDPQTAGGLLAAVPASKLDEVMQNCAQAGQSAWVIGKILRAQGSAAPLISVIPAGYDG